MYFFNAIIIFFTPYIMLFMFKMIYKNKILNLNVFAFSIQTLQHSPEFVVSH